MKIIHICGFLILLEICYMYGKSHQEQETCRRCSILGGYLDTQVPTNFLFSRIIGKVSKRWVRLAIQVCKLGIRCSGNTQILEQHQTKEDWVKQVPTIMVLLLALSLIKSMGVIDQYYFLPLVMCTPNFALSLPSPCAINHL